MFQTGRVSGLDSGPIGEQFGQNELLPVKTISGCVGVVALGKRYGLGVGCPGTALLWYEPVPALPVMLREHSRGSYFWLSVRR